MLDHTLNQSSKYRRKIWVEINDDARGTYNNNSQIKFKAAMLKSTLCDYNGAYILVKGTKITTEIPSAADEAGKRLEEINKVVIFKNSNIQR